MSPAERKRQERQRTLDADKVRIEVKIAKKVFEQLEQLQGPDKAVSRDDIVEAAIVAAFGQRPKAKVARSVFDQLDQPTLQKAVSCDDLAEPTTEASTLRPTRKR